MARPFHSRCAAIAAVAGAKRDATGRCPATRFATAAMQGCKRESRDMCELCAASLTNGDCAFPLSATMSGRVTTISYEVPGDATTTETIAVGEVRTETLDPNTGGLSGELRVSQEGQDFEAFEFADWSVLTSEDILALA